MSKTHDRLYPNQLRDDLAKFDGTWPYADPGNVCKHDPYFAQSLIAKYERWGIRSIDDMRRKIKEAEQTTEFTVQF